MNALVRKPDPELTVVQIEVPRESAIEFYNLLGRRGIQAGDMFALMVRSFAGRNQTLGLTDTVRFGKYAGYQLEQIIRGDPRYIRWLLSESTTIDVDEDAFHLLQEIDPPSTRRGSRSRQPKDM